MIARGVDVPEAELVINLDVPTKQKIGSKNKEEK
jgi:superfamily II DNA/RNA helicase